MATPRWRKLKKEVGEILLLTTRKEALDQLEKIPGKMVTGPLFSHFYSINDLVRFRSTAAMGRLVANLAENRIEDARIVLRRIMWNLNDESGGIGWGSVEAMGEILANSNSLAQEFSSILFSYIAPQGNFLEHEMLQRGSLWGVGTYLAAADAVMVDGNVTENLCHFLDSPDSVKRGYAVRALVNMSEKNRTVLPSPLFLDTNKVPLFDGWDIRETTVSSIAKNNTHKLPTGAMAHAK
ncbi:MAG: hypothetical protein R6V54_06975 [Desulfobacteraceae bacterium]